MDKFRNLFKYKVLPIYWAFLTYILLKPSDVKREDLWMDFSYIDKIVHTSAFTLLSICYCIAFPKQKFYIFLAILLMYSLLTEVLQEVMNLGRSMEVGDFIADVLGVLLGYFIWKKINILSNKE